MSHISLSATKMDPEIVGLHLTRRMMQVLVLLGLASAAISLGCKWAGRALALGGHTSDTRPVEIVIGNDVLAVPANAIRLSEARRNGVARRLDLYLQWPSMRGFSAETRDDFNHAGDSRRIIFLTIEERVMSRDMSGRYGPIYAGLIEPDGLARPAGIVLHEFRPSSGYFGETLAIGPRAADEPFVARCLEPALAKQSLAPCERDLMLGGNLSLTYRFPETLLAEWPMLDSRVLGALEPMLQAENRDQR